MGLKNWIINFLGGAVIVDGDCSNLSDLRELMRNAAYREMALFHAIDLIARCMCKCEIKTYAKGKEMRGELWYRWNVQPNDNQSSSQFMRQLIYKLYTERECLVIVRQNQMYVADSFVRNEGGTKPDAFESVTVGDTTFRSPFKAQQVMYWNMRNEIHGRGINSVLDLVNDQYSGLLAYCMRAYQTSRGNKALFKYEALPPNVNLSAEGAAEKWLAAQTKRYSEFMAADGGVAPVGKGVALEPFGVSKTYANESTRDIRSMIDDISDFTAKAFGIPPALLRGDVEGTSDAVDLFVTTCIDPLADFLREEIVRKEPTLGKAMLKNGNDLIIDTTQIKHVDLLDSAVNVDKLIACGVCCANDIYKMLGMPEVDEPWAKMHFVTNNYSTLEDRQTGGENE